MRSTERVVDFDRNTGRKNHTQSLDIGPGFYFTDKQFDSDLRKITIGKRHDTKQEKQEIGPGSYSYDIIPKHSPVLVDFSKKVGREQPQVK